MSASDKPGNWIKIWLPPAGWMTGSATPNSSTRLRSTSTAWESAPAVSSGLAAALVSPCQARRQRVRVHRHEERRAALQIQAELDLAGGVALQPVQDERRRIRLIRRVDEWEIASMSFVPMAARRLANSLFVAAFCSASTRARMFVYVASLVFRARRKLLHQVARRRRIHLNKRPAR